jgi:hypothetical protein
MIEAIRKRYNAEFTEDKYQNFLTDINSEFNFPINFRVAETPVFFDKEFKKLITQAGEEIVDFLVKSDLNKLTANAIPDGCSVPNQTSHTHFLAIDFAICKDEDGNLLPQLIELQGFPSLFAFQNYIGDKYRQHFYVPDNFSQFFNGVNSSIYLEKLKRILLGNHSTENVILLEIEPFKQGTAIDFIATEHYFGIKPVCITEVIKEGKNLYYLKNGIKTQIKRIYNRVIFDELIRRTDLKYDFHLTDDVNVEWAGHPNWFFRISKFIMPYLKSRFVPECRFLSEYQTFPTDLENYVFKPLFSFSGTGIKFHVTLEDLEQVPVNERHLYLLQRKVQYEPILQAPDGKVKVEVRLLYLWEDGEDRPKLMVNLSRLSRGEMIGVKYNKDKTWVGGNVCFFERD